MEMGKVILVAFALVLAIGLTESLDFDERDLASEEKLWDLYERWRSQHTVSRDLEEKALRFNVFKANVMHIHKVNQMDRPYKLELNKFADMTTHEFASSYGGSKVKHYRMLRGPRRATGNFSHGKMVNVPPSVDWRKNGAVTAIKDQGRCGSCWAFSTVVAVEGINYIKTKNLVSLSEQELVDCSTKNYGCNGGLMDDAFQFIKDNNGITTEKNYPYMAKDESCNRAEMGNSPHVAIDGYEDVPENNEDALTKAVANQPVSVAIDARSQDLQFYREGVFNGDCGQELDHGVAIVGYGTTLEGTKYWIVKNSWESEWGEKGYVRIERGIRRKEGRCGIAMEASYPIKLSSNNPESTPTTFKDEL